MGNTCEHGLKKSECYVCMSPKKGARLKDVLDYEANNPDKNDSGEIYMQAYRAGWNDALHELAIDGAEELKTRLWIFANKMKRK